MNPYQIQADDLSDYQQEQIEACPVVNLLGANRLVSPGSWVDNRPLRAGGVGFAFDVSFVVIVSQMIGGTIPNLAVLLKQLANCPFTYLGDNFKVSKFDILSGATMLRIEGNSLNQRA